MIEMLNEKQKQGLEIAVQRYNRGCKYTTIAGYAGTGKAQPNNTKIPTPNGWKYIGDLQVGDEVFDANGKPTKVLGVYPQGLMDNYEMILTDGRKIYCNDEHIFKVLTWSNTTKELTLRQMLEQGIKGGAQKRPKFFIPTIYNKPVEYQKQNLSIPPYIMGAFLGDGCCKEHNLTISSKDDEIPSYIAELGNFNFKREKEEYGYDWHFYFKESFIGEKGKLRIAPKTKEYFSGYEKYIMCYAYEKSIPPEYKYSSIEQRYELLQGLMDTDGSILDNKYFTTRFTSTSLQLINDVKEILYSLGYSHISITQDTRVDKYTTGACYDLYLSIPNSEKQKLFKLKRKKEIAIKAAEKTTRTRYDRLSLLEVNKLEEQVEMTCIYVDNPEHLYLTENFLVTHNTTLAKTLVQSLGLDLEKDVCFTAFCGKAVQVLLDRGNKNCLTLHKLLYKAKPLPNGKFKYDHVEFIPYKVVIVDEVSMASKSLLDDLFMYDCHVIMLGDPF